MSAVLLVTKDKNVLKKAKIGSNSFVIGRAPDCDLPLDEVQASRQHAKIISEGARSWVEDCGSRNGTTVNGKKISSRRELRNGDEIGIGAFQLRFVSAGSAEEEAPLDDDATRPASDIPERKSLGQQVLKKKANGNLRVTLKVTQGPMISGPYENWDGPLTMGRGLDNHIVLADDDLVSTSHARIVQDGNVYKVEDLGSVNGTFRNGVKVVGRETLASGDKIKVGKYILIFEAVDLQKRKKTMLIALGAVSAIALIAVVIKLLQPPDRAGEHIAAGDNAWRKGDITNALTEYKMALQMDPGRAEAKQRVDDTEEAIRVRATLAAAEAFAAEGKYDKAKEYVYRVTRDHPNNDTARKLEAVINSVQEAEIAITSKNWGPAVDLLEKVQERYPNSDLIKQRLVLAKKESAAMENLSKARDALQHQQLDMMEGFLRSIPAESVYFTEARQLLDNSARERKVLDGLDRAKASYRDGKFDDALTQIEEALAAAPDEQRLKDLRDQVRKVKALEPGVMTAESMALATEENPDTLLGAAQSCDAVAKAEPDPLNALRKRALARSDQVRDRLRTLSKQWMAKGADLLTAGKRKEAFQAFSDAVKADGSNQSAQQQLKDVQTLIVAETQKLYRDALKFIDVQRFDLAREKLKQVLDIGIPGEEYYDKSDKKLKSLPAI